MPVKEPAPSPKEVELSTFTPDELNTALYHLVDITDRMAVPFQLLGETARSIIEDNKLAGSAIEIGIKENEFTDQVRSVLRTCADGDTVKLGIQEFETLSSGYSWVYKGIPIHIQTLPQKGELYANPSYAFYWGEMYYHPNPFQRYMEQLNG